MRFEDLRLAKPLLEAVQSAGYETPTPIQARAIPLILDGQDILGCAQTGTGKTAAFALPMLQLLAGRSAQPGPSGRGRSGRVRALVLAPTRELAQQIADSFAEYGRRSPVKHTVVFGGVNKGAQTRALRSGVDVLVATPGRLLDHMADGTVRLDGVEFLVLDEADRMLDMGFIPDIRRILRTVPKRRQTLLFSATMPAPIRELAGEILHKPVSVEVARVSAPAERVDHWAYRVERQDKAALLCSLLHHTPYSRTLVFTRTKHGADKVVRHLTKAGLPASAIHGNKSQNARTRALAGFRSGKVGILVATDIAARGLDIDDISHVINYDLTDEPETYVHRIGRTARAGAAGTALSFVTGEDRVKLRDIERLIQTRLQAAADLPGYVGPPPSIESAPPARTSDRSRGKHPGTASRAPAAGGTGRRRRNRGRARTPVAAR